MNYTGYKFSINPFRPLNEILIARLAELGFESFEEAEPQVQAYIPAERHKPEEVEALIAELAALGEISSSYTTIPDQNWNAEWEKSYPIVTVDDKCIIRAPFHEKPGKKYTLDIVINPQMSFGTGHHETTFLVTKMLFDLQMKNKTVLDMGSGTGVLAIAAAKLGAARVVAIDNEDWAYENTRENCKRNAVDIDVQKADTIPADAPQFDLILANINKNVLLSLMGSLSQNTASGGTLVLSGFFDTDGGEIKEVADAQGFVSEKEEIKNKWMAIRFKKK